MDVCSHCMMAVAGWRVDATSSFQYSARHLTTKFLHTEKKTFALDVPAEKRKNVTQGGIMASFISATLSASFLPFRHGRFETRIHNYGINFPPPILLCGKMAQQKNIISLFSSRAQQKETEKRTIIFLPWFPLFL